MNYVEKALEKINFLIEKSKENSEEQTDYMVIKQALEKQIPKKPTYDNRGFATHYNCPECGRLYWEKESIGNYCDSCGQKFDLEA